MKYFSSLPNVTFKSTIGNFTISSFFHFYNFDIKDLYLTKTTVDNKTTLTELSQTIYEDNNSMWLFLVGNETTDPFNLLAENSTLYKNSIQNNIVLGLNPPALSTGNYVNPVGSIITQYAPPSGPEWLYSSVGNFDLDGPFTLIDSTDYFSGKMTIKEQKNGSPFITVNASIDSVSVIENNDQIYITDDQEYNTKDKTTEADNVVFITQKNSGSIYPTATEYQAIFAAAAAPQPSYENSGPTFAVTNYFKNLSTNKSINVILPSDVSFLINNLKSLSYT